MNQYLESAIQRYPKDSEKNLLHPISKEDAEIFTEIIEIIKKSDLADIALILDSYKFAKDSEVLFQLKDWNAKHAADNDNISEADTDIKKKFSGIFKKDFIYFQNLRMNVACIQCYEKQDVYNFAKGAMDYLIVINDLPATTSVTNITTNKRIRYDDIEIRDHDFDTLDNYIKNFPGIQFINRKDE